MASHEKPYAFAQMQYLMCSLSGADKPYQSSPFADEEDEEEIVTLDSIQQEMWIRLQNKSRHYGISDTKLHIIPFCLEYDSQI